MSHPLAANEVYRATIVTYGNGQVGEMVLHYQVAGVTGTPTDQDLATFLDTRFAPLVKPLFPAPFSYRGVQVQRVYPKPLTLAVVGSAGAGPGTDPGSSMPTQVAGLIHLSTGLSGRSYRGRVYVPFPTVSFVTAAGQPNAAYLALLAALATAVQTGVTTVGAGGSASLNAVLWSRKLSVATQLIAAGTAAVAAWATQRRRGDYGRPNLQPF